MLACLITVERAAAADGPDVGALIVPGACFVHSVSEKARTIDRIELQLMQVIGKDRSPIGGIRVQLGIQPRMATTRSQRGRRSHIEVAKGTKALLHSELR